MNKRLDRILTIVETKEHCTISELAEHFKVSEMTIRRDVNELSKQKKIIKEHGGIRRLSNILSTNEKMVLNVENKRYIGSLMNNCFNDDDVIFLGAGTTFYYSLASLNKKYKYIITNSIVSFNWLLQNNYPNIYLTGGEIFEKTGEFYGEHAEKLLDSINIDVAFIATNGVFENNITTSKPILGRLQSKAIHNAKKSYVLADSTKFNYADTYTFATLDRVTGVITDKELTLEILQDYKKYTQIINE